MTRFLNMFYFKPQITIAIALTLSLCACGGSASDNNNKPSTEIPLINTPTPNISSVTPTITTLGSQTTFNVIGTNLTNGMTFVLDNCNAVTELIGGTSTFRQFSCTPFGNSGSKVGSIYMGSDSSKIFFKLNVEYHVPIMSVDTSSFGSALVTPDGSLYTWGQYPKKIGDGYQSVAVGENALFGIKKDSSLWVIGRNFNGILGIPSIISTNVPIQVGDGYKKIIFKGQSTTSGESVVALKNDGTIWVWGSRTSGKTDSYEPSYVPRMLAGTGFTEIARGSTGETLALKADGSLWILNINQPPSKTNQKYDAIATTLSTSYGLKSDGTLWIWGTFSANSDIENPIKSNSGIKSISAGSYEAIALKTDGTLLTATPELMGHQYISITAADSCRFGQKFNGTLWAWGYCNIGDGSYGKYITTPTQILETLNTSLPITYTLSGKNKI